MYVWMYVCMYVYGCDIQMYFGTTWTVWAPKKVLVTLLPYIFHVKTKWNIICEYWKMQVFSRDTNILPKMYWASNIFGPLATTFGFFWVSLNYPILNFKKMVSPKTSGCSTVYVCMYACMYVCMNVYMYVCMHACMYKFQMIISKH